jgi:hypothetical protein
MSENVKQTGDGGELLDCPSKEVADLKTIARALRNRWVVSPEVKAKLIARMQTIIEKERIEVPTKEGSVLVDGPADSNAVRAASVLAQLESQNQADDHLAEKHARLDDGKATERLDGVVMQVIGPRRS